MSLPYVAYSEELLDRCPLVYEGEFITCPCGHDHMLYALIGEGGKNGKILFYQCGEKSYLAAIGNRCVIYIKNEAT